MKVVALILTMFLAAVSAAGQVKKITVTEFNTQMNAAFGASDKKVRRTIEKSETFENGKVTQSATITREYIPPDRMHYVFDELIFGERRVSEWIIIDETRYEKDAGGEWFLSTPIRTIMGATNDSDAGMKFTSQASKLGKLPVTIIKRVESPAAGELRGDSTFAMYIRRDGLIAKTEQTTFEVGKANYKKEVTTYTYAPKGLKIEAPIK